MRSSDSGFTLLELLVVCFLGLMLTALTLTFTQTQRLSLGTDMARTRLTQNLRGSLDIIGADVRIAGENLAAAFPAILITDNGSGSPDTLTLRRSIINEVLPVCQAVSAGTSQVYFAIPGNVAGCTRSGHTNDYNAWQTQRLADSDQSVRAYIWDSVAKMGEFFDYTGEADTGTAYYILRGGAPTWSRTYPVGSSSVYMLEEWKFDVDTNLLRVTREQQTGSINNVSFRINNFQVRALMQDNTIKTSFTATDNWSQLKAIEVTLIGDDEYAKNLITRSISSQFFPRNVLSN